MSKIDKDNLKTMTIDEVHERIKQSMIDGGNVLSVSRGFAPLKNDFERVAFVSDLFDKYAITVPFVGFAKNDEKSLEIRRKGNEMYKNKEYMAALYTYNESIAYAPAGSETAGLAYGNRSAILLHFEQYTGCLEDITRAENSNYPSNLMHKLQERRTKCEELLNNKSAPTKPLLSTDELLLGPNDEIPCASAALSILYTQDMGRHIVAKHDIAAGAVLALEEPYCTSLLHSMRYNRCNNCLRKYLNLIPCPTCVDAMFCDEQCLRDGLDKYHGIDCAIGPSLVALELTKVQSLSVRVAIRALTNYNSDMSTLKKEIEEIEEHARTSARTAGFTKDSNGILKYDSSAYAPTHSLITNSERRLPADLFYRSVVATGVLRLIQNYTTIGSGFSEDDATFFGGLLLRHLQTSACNMHTISELGETSDNDVQLGNGAFTFNSLMNHSCSPNVTRHNAQRNGRRIMKTVAIMPIAAGEQITDNYGYHYAMTEREERRSGLEHQYLFRCNCIACEQNYPLYWNLPVLPGVPRSLILKPDMKRLQEHDKNFAREKLPEYMKQLNALAYNEPRPNKQICDLQEAAKQCLAVLAIEDLF